MSSNPRPTSTAEIATMLKVLADPRRLQILEALMNGIQCNCELGKFLDMAPNLISHHLRVLREAGLVEVERDPLDQRWIYYSVNERTLESWRRVFGAFLDPARIKPRRTTCGPSGSLVRLEEIGTTA